MLKNVQLLLLHALPLDASMWAAQMSILPGATIAPDLYRLGSSLEEWARSVLELTDGGPMIVVGNSIGGSCALEVAALAPDRVKAIVLVGAKAGHRPDAALRDAAIDLLRARGIAAAWLQYWAPLFSHSTDRAVIEEARAIACKQRVDEVINGVGVFHGRRDMSEFAARWPHRLVVINGEDDVAPAATASAKLAASAPEGEFHLIADCGHYVNLEWPEAFNGILANVVAEIAAEPRGVG